MGHSHRPARLGLDRLDDRIVPSATRLDLTTRGAEATAAGAVVRQIDGMPADDLGTFLGLRPGGWWDWFHREQGYNTDARPLQFHDEVRDPSVTHALRLSDVPEVVVDGQVYREFVLDVGDGGWGRSWVTTLDEVQLFTSDNPDLHGYSARHHTLGGQAPVFDLDSGGDVSVVLNGRLNRGQGKGDMDLLVPDSVFAGADPGAFVFLYSKFGGPGAADCGGESWSVRKDVPPPNVPNPASLSGTVYVDTDFSGTFNAGDTGVPGVTVTLTGTNDLGQAVNVTTTTAADGTFSFKNLRPGTYTVTIPRPAGFADGTVSGGTLGGTPVDTTTDRSVTNLVVAAGVNGTDITFGEFKF